MSEITFPADQRSRITNALREYLREHFELDPGQFDTEFLLDFISREFGALYYNQGLRDAQAQLSRRIDDVLVVIDELEQPPGDV